MFEQRGVIMKTIVVFSNEYTKTNMEINPKYNHCGHIESQTLLTIHNKTDGLYLERIVFGGV